MASNRRIGAEDSETRAALLDATEQLMLEDGYAAVSSRRIAGRAGLKPQLVHYYFRTMDDLFLAAFRRRAEAGLERQVQAIASEQPLRALWALSDESARHRVEDGVRRAGQPPKIHPLRNRPLWGVVPEPADGGPRRDHG